MNTLTTKKVLSSLKIVVLALILAAGIQYSHADFSDPGFSPPTCPSTTVACNAPVNVGNTSQVKLGSLMVNGSTQAQNALGFTAWGKSVFNITGQTGAAVQIIDGNQATGKVLTSIDSSGDAMWETAGSGSLPSCPAGFFLVSTNSGWACGTSTSNGGTYYYPQGCSANQSIIAGSDGYMHCGDEVPASVTTGSTVSATATVVGAGETLSCPTGDFLVKVNFTSQNSGDEVTGSGTCAPASFGF